MLLSREDKVHIFYGTEYKRIEEEINKKIEEYKQNKVRAFIKNTSSAHPYGYTVVIVVVFDLQKHVEDQ